MMPQKKSVEELVNVDLEIEEHIDLQKKGWIVQRIGLCIMLVFVLLALFGLFGDGMLSKRTNTIRNVTLEHERFYRHEGPMELKIEVGENRSAGVDISFPVQYMKSFEVRSILPEPRENRVEHGKVHYLFDASGPTNITFYLTPREIGTIAGTVAVNDAIFSVNHFIYP
jgi:hypothetical protein